VLSFKKLKKEYKKMKPIKLKNLLNEILQTWQVEAFLNTDRRTNITDVLNQVRALRKVTIVSNITPPELQQKPNVESTIIKMKFVTRGNPKADIIQFKKDIMTSDLEDNDLKIPGVLAVIFRENTLSRLSNL
tara:strand:+ start:34 stop:429 length:396 start_codon:yes stop_codon:yes gene_type:complete